MRPIPPQPYIQLWEKEMEKFTGDVPFGKICMFCQNVLQKSDNAYVTTIKDNSFLRNDYQTSVLFKNNICVCGLTDDCFVQGLFEWREHLTHYAHRKCFEENIKNQFNRPNRGNILCPWVLATFKTDTLPLSYVRSNKHVYFMETFKKEIEKGEVCDDLGSLYTSLNHEWINEDEQQRVYNENSSWNEAFKRYSHFYDGPINIGLRTHRITELCRFIVDEMIEYFDTCTPYPEPICLYRGIKEEYENNVLKMLKVGDVIEAFGFTSQSLSASKAAGFGDGGIMVLCYDSGAKFCYMGDDRISDFPDEEEMLTYPNQRLHFTHSAVLGDERLYYFHVESVVVHLQKLIDNKQLFITYNYDETFQNYQEEENTLAYSESGDFVLKHNELSDADQHRHIVIFRKNQSVEYFKKVVSETPSLIVNISHDYLNANLCLLALSYDISLLPLVWYYVRREIERVREILYLAFANGYMLQFEPNEEVWTYQLASKAIEYNFDVIRFIPKKFGFENEREIWYKRKEKYFVRVAISKTLHLSSVPSVFVDSVFVVRCMRTNIVNETEAEQLLQQIPANLYQAVDVFAAFIELFWSFMKKNIHHSSSPIEVHRIRLLYSTKYNLNSVYNFPDIVEEFLVEKMLREADYHYLIELPLFFCTRIVVLTLLKINFNNINYIASLGKLHNDDLTTMLNVSLRENKYDLIKASISSRFFNMENAMYYIARYPLSLFIFDNSDMLLFSDFPLYLAFLTDIFLTNEKLIRQIYSSSTSLFFYAYTSPDENFTYLARTDIKVLIHYSVNARRKHGEESWVHTDSAEFAEVYISGEIVKYLKTKYAPYKIGEFYFFDIKMPSFSTRLPETRLTIETDPDIPPPILAPDLLFDPGMPTDDLPEPRITRTPRIEIDDEIDFSLPVLAAGRVMPAASTTSALL